jgi:hypothetical protein
VGQAGAFRVSAAAPDSGAPQSLVAAQNVDDPWNFWVFEVSADLELQGEETERQRQQGGSFEARRTTPTWKLEMQIDGNRSRDERELEDGSLIVDERTFWDAGVLLAYALADHWSLGVISGAGASTRRNQDFGADAAAALEYSFFPYADAPRQSLTARYGMGLQYFDWEEETIYFETEELRVQQHAQVQLFQRQQWGESRVSIEARQFLHDLGTWSAFLSGDIEFRVFRGRELEVSGELGFIEDQLAEIPGSRSERAARCGRASRDADGERIARRPIRRRGSSQLRHIRLLAADSPGGRFSWPFRGASGGR